MSPTKRPRAEASALARSVEALNQTVWHTRGIRYDDAAVQRGRPEPADDLRTPFQSDKERIVLSKAFRRLKHKTQVFWTPRNDHFRTRLTHTIEVAQTARTLGSLLGLNADLVEAISYGHDVGHGPFGHAGERAIKDWIDRFLAEESERPDQERDPDLRRGTITLTFNHHAWAHKLLQEHEELPFADPGTPRGLNLTNHVASGIAHPSLENASLLEAQVVGAADDLVWINHDEDDFRQAGFALRAAAFNAIRAFGSTRNERMQWALRTIQTESESDGTRVVLGDELASAVAAVTIEHHRVYDEDQMWQHHEKGARTVIHALLDFYATSDPDFIEATLRRLTGRGSRGAGGTDDISFLQRWRAGAPRVQSAIEHVAKMSDTFALDLYRYVYSPETVDYYF
jgi:dGTP triphosphohydrolase